MLVNPFRFLIVCLLIAAIQTVGLAQRRVTDVAKVEEEKPAEDSPTTPAKPANKDDDTATVPRPVATPFGPRQVRLHLMDGSIIGGDLSVDSIVVKTSFGDLEVPVEKIRSFRPGLDSYPELLAKIDKLFDDLGANDYKARESARKELIGYGLKIQNELDRFASDTNAERKRHLEEIRKAFEELADEQEDDFEGESTDKAWIRGDTVVTTEFTVVGRIAQDSFTITSKYGPLTVKLADVQMGDRATGEKAEMQKSLTVDGTNLVQLNYKSTGIRVEKGDKITVRADGQITMSPWGSNVSSTPDGGQNYGWYVQNEIPGGALVAKIGSSGKEFKVGSRSTTIAKSSGVLQFGVAMQHQYANQGYSYPGNYNVRVKVQPK